MIHKPLSSPPPRPLLAPLGAWTPPESSSPLAPSLGEGEDEDAPVLAPSPRGEDDPNTSQEGQPR
jgi:hypothetical protein